MTKITRGDGWNVFLSDDRLFIVDTATGTRRADFEIDDALLTTLRNALTEQSSEKAGAPKKKSTRKKASE